MKRPTREERHQSCARKRRYRSHADALDAAMLVGVERQRTAFRCPWCGQWPLATKPARDR
jgi:hypothetical protein